ncbi:MAG: ferredoxin [Burkholderiaceae bacterium]
MRITIDEDKCCGAGQCVLLAPQVFDQRQDDGVVILLNEAPTGEQAVQAKTAARHCPAQAIIIDEQADQA